MRTVSVRSISSANLIVCHRANDIFFWRGPDRCEPDDVLFRNRNHLEVTFLQPALQRAARSERRNLHIRDIILRAQTRELGLERFLLIAQPMQLQGEIDIAKSRRRQQSGDHNPARQRSCPHPIELSLAVHPSFSATRKFALRARALKRCAFSLGSTGLDVMTRRSRSLFGRGSGHSGRSTYWRLRSRKKFFTIRSSRE